MPISSNSKKKEIKPKLSRVEHSELLKNSLKSQKEAPEILPSAAAAANPADSNDQASLKIPAPGPTVFTENPESLRIVEKTRASLTVEQTVVYNPGKGGPMVSVKLRLTTGVGGQRKSDGLSETAYLLRLEVLSASGRARVEGFSLGPWRTESQQWEAGSIFVSHPVWAAFQPQSGPAKGRLYIFDVDRNRLLDLPWKTESFLPGFKPLV